MFFPPCKLLGAPVLVVAKGAGCFVGTCQYFAPTGHVELGGAYELWNFDDGKPDFHRMALTGQPQGSGYLVGPFPAVVAQGNITAYAFKDHETYRQFLAACLGEK